MTTSKPTTRKAKSPAKSHDRPIVGRKKKAFDKDLFEELCMIQCTEAEIAGCMGMSVKTLEDTCQEVYGMHFFEVYSSKSAHGKQSLRRQQWYHAVGRPGIPAMQDGVIVRNKNGTVQWIEHPIASNPVMLIWLGKQYLGQADSQVDHHGDDNRQYNLIVQGGEEAAKRLQTILGTTKLLPGGGVDE